MYVCMYVCMYVFNPRSSKFKDTKIILDVFLLNVQHYKVWIKGK